MDKNRFFKLVIISFVLFLCCALILPTEVFAASEGAENTTIELSAEERAYIERTGEITIGCPIQNCPLLFQNKKTKQLEGITIDILNMVSEATGLKFRYQALPSGNITYETLQQLQIDMVTGVEFNDINKHSTGIAITDPYLHAEKVFVCKKGVVFNPDSEMTIAVASGSQTLKKVIQQQYPMFEVLFFDSTEKALSALLSGKADAVLQNQYTIERILFKPIYEDLHIVATATIGDSQCLACLVPIGEDKNSLISSDISILLSIINKGIASLDKNQVAFLIIKETSENTYKFTIWDIIYRYRFAITIIFISLLLILLLLRKNHLLHLKHSEQMAAEQRAKELAEINERMKEQQLLLMDSLKHAEEGNRTKTFFLFNMSHDIRTPMNAILGFAEIAQRSMNDTAKLKDCIEKIQVSGKHLLHLIDNILEMAKIENGNVTLAEECCNLGECIKKARNILQADIDKKHLIFRTDMSTVKNKWVYCDNIRLNQVLFNILSNAVKFSKPGGSILITISQNMCALKEYADYEIHVKDNGIGMTQEFLTHIFEPFEREHTSTVSQTQGVGLGMSITKNLVDLMGGTIQVLSELDKGTEFVLKFTFKFQEQEAGQKQVTKQEQAGSQKHALGQQQVRSQRQAEGQEQAVGHKPVKSQRQAEDQKQTEGQEQAAKQEQARSQEQASEPEQQPLAETESADDFSGKRLLLVEDNELNMEIAQELLCAVGFEIETAQNGQIAVEMVQNSTAGYYDAILMDIQMPVMNGYEASEKIRSLENKALAAIPIIALTANTFDEDKKKAMSYGMNAYVAKPIDVNALYETLRNTLKEAK